MRLIEGFLAGLVIATITAPVGVSGAVFLLPVQMSFLHVPNPSVTPTNLIYNVVAGPGALLRYRRSGQLAGPLARRLVAGTLPGVVIGVVIRVYLVPGAQAFRLVAAAVLLPLGIWLCRRALTRNPRPRAPLSPRAVTTAAVLVGVVGGVYGIGGGSILGPILVGTGLSIAVVAPAALASTFVTSIVGALAYAVLALFVSGSIAPDWPIGLACGLGGMVGGYIGAWIQPLIPETALTLLLGGLAIAIALTYVVDVVR